MSLIKWMRDYLQYNEEGLPIVEITEPYYSEDEDDKDVKATQPGLLPFSQKTPKEQAEDRAILDRIAELEREDEERERRREAGETVTSDEETESEEDEYADYDDGESEDEFRPKALDSDEEYEEEVWEHSGNEDEEDEDEDDTQGKDSATSSSKKSVRFADQVARATKSSLNKQKATVPSSNSAKPKSPTDLYNQMRDRQQAVRSAGSGPMVNMANLESTFANMMTPSGGLGKAPVFETTPTVASDDTAAPLKSALKPTPKKVSRFKQSRAAQSSEVEEPATSVATIASDDQQTDTPPKKLSKFAMSRMTSSAASSTEASSPTPAKPAVRGVSEMVFERNVTSPVPPKQSTAAGMSEVVEKNVVKAAKKTTDSAPPSVAGVKDVIENTFTKPSGSAAITEQPKSGRKKPSLFRQQQQQTSAHLEPEPAVPGSSFDAFSDSDDNLDDAVVRPGSSVPEVISASVVARGPIGTVSKRSPTVGSKAPSASLKAGTPIVRSIPVVESAKLKDTALMKGAVVEHEDIEPVDEDELEEDMLMRQVTFP